MLFTKSLAISLLSLFFIACSHQERGDNEIYIGTISGPETQLMKVAQNVAREQFNLNLQILEFEDYVTPNIALAEGSIDANMFQHQQYLDITLEMKHYPIVSIGKTFIYPMGLYSQKWQALDSIRNKATVAMPNDPSNSARALRLLAQAGLISLIEGNDLELTTKHITSNPKELVFKELDAALLPRILDDVDIALINTNYAIPAGLLPLENALFLESKDSPYANIVVVRESEKDHSKYQLLLKALRSDAVQEKARTLFSSQAIPAW